MKEGRETRSKIVIYRFQEAPPRRVTDHAPCKASSYKDRINRLSVYECTIDFTLVEREFFLKRDQNCNSIDINVALLTGSGEG